MKTKVWICASNDGIDLQNSVNEFIKDKNIVDIKYQAVYCSANHTVNDRALVVYTEME